MQGRPSGRSDIVLRSIRHARPTAPHSHHAEAALHVVTAHRRRILAAVWTAVLMVPCVACADTSAQDISAQGKSSEELPMAITSSDWQANTLVVDDVIIMSPTPAWSGTLQGVMMDRDDDIDLRWNDGGTDRISTVESDLNAGFRVRLSHQTPFRISRPGQITEFSLLRTTGEGETEFRPGEYYSNHGELLTTRLGYGWTNLLLRGRSETTLGARYTHIADAFDHVTRDDLAVGENHVVTVDATATGYWDWRALVLSAGLSGGIGGSLIDQSGVRMDGSFATFSRRRGEFATAYEAHADVLWKITDQTFLQLGARGFMVQGVAQARDTWGAAGDSSTARWLGMTLGVWRDF